MNNPSSSVPQRNVSMSMSERFTTHAECRVRYISIGESDTAVLILHGWGGTIESFAPVIQDLSPLYRVVALDFPGHGRSALPDSAWAVGDFAELVKAILSREGIKRVDIIAHSFGGRVAIRLASKYPELIRRLVLVDSAGVKSTRLRHVIAGSSLFRVLDRVARRTGALGTAARRVARVLFGSADDRSAGALRPTFRRVIVEDLTPELELVKSPTLLVWGAKDTATPLKDAYIMKAKIPDAQLVVLDNAGHFSYLDQFPKFRLLVRQFLANADQ